MNASLGLESFKIKKLVKFFMNHRCLYSPPVSVYNFVVAQISWLFLLFHFGVYVTQSWLVFKYKIICCFLLQCAWLLKSWGLKNIGHTEGYQTTKSTCWRIQEVHKADGRVLGVVLDLVNDVHARPEERERGVGERELAVDEVRVGHELLPAVQLEHLGPQAAARGLRR